MLDKMLTLYRRHATDCPHRKKGRRYTKCDCPVWVQGVALKEPVRTSLSTRSWPIAQAKLAALERGDGEPAVKLFTEACAEFAKAMECGTETKRKNERRIKFLMAYAAKEKLVTVAAWDLVALDGYKAWRREVMDLLAWSKELQFLRQLWRWFVARKYTRENPATAMNTPKNIPQRERVPFTHAEITAILAACSRIGRTNYERLRAHAAVLLALRYGMRVSDIACLKRASVRPDSIYLRTLKNNQQVWAPLYPEVASALAAVPPPRGMDAGSEYYFWSGRGTRKGHVTTFAETLQAVFRHSAVPDAHTHRFRHTLASELLGAGGTIEDVAALLGDDPETIREHYSHWIPARQNRLSTLLGLVQSQYNTAEFGSQVGV